MERLSPLAAEWRPGTPEAIPLAWRSEIVLFLGDFIDRRVGALAEEETLGAAVAVAGELVLLVAGVLRDEFGVVVHEGLRRHLKLRLVAGVEVGEAAGGQLGGGAQVAFTVLEGVGGHQVEHLAAAALFELDVAEFALDLRDAFAVNGLDDGDEDNHVVVFEVIVVAHHGIGKLADGGVGIDDERTQSDVGLQLAAGQHGVDAVECAVADLNREDDLGAFGLLRFGEIHASFVVELHEGVVVALRGGFLGEAVREVAFHDAPKDGT